MTKYEHVVKLDKTPTHHNLRPGDWWQFLFDDSRYNLPMDRFYEVGDVYIHKFKDEPFKRQFRIDAIPIEGVYECSYLSRC